jgi:hypothetical protein
MTYRDDYTPADFDTDDPEASRMIRLARTHTPATAERTPGSLGLDDQTAADLDQNPDAIADFLGAAL